MIKYEPGRSNGCYIVLSDDSRFCLQHRDDCILVCHLHEQRTLSMSICHRYTGPSFG
ncbi:hypothetical protein NPIL_565031, partial [Nephila pilipes]